MYQIYKSLFKKSKLVSKIMYGTHVGHVLFRHANQPTNVKYFPLNLWYAHSSCSLRWLYHHNITSQYCLFLPLYRYHQYLVPSVWARWSNQDLGW